MICLLCLKEHHQNHKTKAMQDVIAIETDSLSKNLEQINKITTDEKEKMQQEQIVLNIKRDGEKAKQKVKELTDNLVKKLRKNEQQLLSEIQESITRAERNLRIINHHTQAQEYIKYFIDNSTASEMIDSRLNKSKQTLTYKPFPKTIHGVEFVPNQALSEKVNCGLGLLRISFKQPDPKVSAIKVVPSELKTMIKAKLVVELKTSKAEVAGEHLENVAIQFTPEDDVKVEEIQMTDDGEITVDFVPRVAGQLTADIKLHGNPVCNSPLVMLVKPQQIKEITEHSKLKDALNTGSMDFTGIAVNRTNSKIAVTDWKSHCIRVFNMEGDLLLTYGSEGQGQRQLNRPEGLAFLNNTDLVISEHQGNQIHIVNTITGQPVRTFGCHGNGDGQFKGPRAVHVDEDSNIIVCDCSNQRVQVFTKHGDYLYQFSLLDLTHSTVKHNQKFYVSTNQAVHVIKRKDNQSCTTVGTISVKDYTDGPLERAWGLTIDNNNNLLVCDFRGCLIHKFTLDGRYMGRSDKLANGPRYIAVLPDGEVICTTEIGVVCFKN